MSIIQFPADLRSAGQTWAQKRNDVEFRSAFGAQALEASAPVWAVSITATPDPTQIGRWKALLLQLRGRTNQLALWDKGREQPIGTMRGSMTAPATFQGATSLTITAAGQAGKTLLAGDYLGVGTGLLQQVVMVVADAVANASGVINVVFEPALRNSLSAGAVVTWYRPCALFRRQDSTSQWENKPGGIVDGLSLDLLEDWRS
jgi:hypothetical protein